MGEATDICGVTHDFLLWFTLDRPQPAHLWPEWPDFGIRYRIYDCVTLKTS